MSAENGIISAVNMKELSEAVSLKAIDLTQSEQEIVQGLME